MLPGSLVAAPAQAAGPRETLLWQSPAFALPFEFSIDEILGIRFKPAALPAMGDWRFHLRDGDVVSGTLEEIDADRVTATLGMAGRTQRVRIDRGALDRIVRSGNGAGSGYIGPGGLADWEQSPAASWREAANGIATETRGAAIVRDIAAPARAVYDIVLSWKTRPAFRIALAAAPGKPQDEPYRLEMFGTDDNLADGLLLVREERDRASSEPLAGDEDAAAEAAPARRLRVVLFVDQTKGRLAVVLPELGSAKPRVDVTIPPPADRKPSGRFRLTNSGDVCLESIRVMPWNGDAAAVEQPRNATVVGRGGLRTDGVVESLAKAGGEIVVRGEAGVNRLPLADVQEIDFVRAKAAGAEQVSPASIRALCLNDEAVAGDLAKVDAEAVWLRRDGFDEPVAVPHAAIRSLDSRRSTVPRELPGRVGRLRHEGIDIRGCMVAAVDGGVAWRPVGSLSASPFAAAQGGGTPAAVVHYVEPREDEPDQGDEVGGIGGQVEPDADGFFVIVMMRDDGAAALDGRIRPGDRILEIAPEKGSRFVAIKGLEPDTVMNLLRGRIGTPVRLKVADSAGGEPRQIELARGTIHVNNREILKAALDAHANLAPGDAAVPEGGAEFPALVFLRTGDVLPCAVDAIDAEGILLRSPLADSPKEAVFVPAGIVQAVELVPSAASRGIDKTRMDRLLTVPRMQRANPPTHLVRLVDGDYLRGRIDRLDAGKMRIALVDAVRELPRDAVVRVIWLHPEELAADGQPPEAAAGQKGPGVLVQGVAADGRRVTIAAERVDGALLRGPSPAIGESSIDTATVDRLLIGQAIDGEADDLPYRQWKLKPAPEPRALRERQPAAHPEAGS